MTYQETVDFLYNQLPVYQRDGGNSINYKLKNTLDLCAFLGNPHQKFKSIHIAGTNGKGSTSHYCAAILQEAGYKVGLYTSPHLKSFTERIKINGNEITEKFVIDFVERIKPMLAIKPSFFELTVAMAFDYFASEKVDIAVIEVGLGGRLDSTNVISPILSHITNIGLDHQQFLGETLAEIASEKAGIIKPNTPVVVSEFQAEIASVFELKAKTENAPLHWGYDFKIDESLIRDLPVFQHKNLKGVCRSMEILTSLGFHITDNHIKNGVKNMLAITGLKGRWQILHHNPLIVCDTGHNEHAFSLLLEIIKTQKAASTWMVLGMVSDKDHDKILKLLPKNYQYIFSEPSISRKISAKDLAEKAEKHGIKGQIIPNVNDAIKFVQNFAQPDDFIFIGGSNFVVADIDGL